VETRGGEPHAFLSSALDAGEIGQLLAKCLTPGKGVLVFVAGENPPPPLLVVRLLAQ
jgi:hypothetical protein